MVKTYYCTIIFLLTIFTGTTVKSQQTCTGSFGENIFTDGDFGAGKEVVYPSDPRIAPGYTYTTNTPPSDGYYTLTNDMSKWPQSYGSWIAIQDNSNDPDGYMMVVNASHSPGIFYEQSIKNLCPNTIYEFSVDVINIVRRGVSNHIYPELEFLIDGEVKHNTGAILQDERWHKHGFTFSLEPGQTSLKLTLVNKAPGGSGNDLALDNITFRPCGTDEKTIEEQNLYFCKDDADSQTIQTKIDTNDYKIQWQKSDFPNGLWRDTGKINTTEFEQDLSRAGTYYYRFLIGTTLENLNNPNCRTFSEVITAEVLPVEFEIWDTICAGNTRPFNGRSLTSSGEYTASFISSRGCDSIVTLHLEVVDKLPLAFVISKQNPLCHNTEDGWVEIRDVRGGYPPYQYVLDRDTNLHGNFEGLKPGTSTITVIDRHGCEEEGEVKLFNPDLFVLETIPNIQIVLGERITLELTANEKIARLSSTPDIFKDCENCNPVNFLPARSGTVHIQAENENGCTSEIEFYIDIDTENLPIAFPNAFSPNGDGINDVFRVITSTQLIKSIKSAKILDRWGNVIHRFSNDTLGQLQLWPLWDGTDGNLLADPGVYVYTCELELINGETRLFSGEIHLLR